MNSIPRNRFWFYAAITCLIGLTSHTALGQNLYFVSKSQNFVQTAGTGAVPDPDAPFGFSVQAATNVTFTLPAGGTVSVPFSAGNGDYEIDQSFGSKSALDAAFPAGTYRMTGTGIPTFSFNLTTDLYPTVTPQVTGGTWNAGGLLVVDPTQTATITFNTFAGYATTGVAGHMETRVDGLLDSVRLPAGDNSGILSVANPFGITVQTTPLTSIVIPARTLTNGRVYQATVQFETASTFDTTTVSGSGVVALYNKTLTFLISAQTPGTSTLPPVINLPPTNQTGVVGGSATFSLNVTVGGASPVGNIVIDWSFNGRQITNFDGSKYTFGDSNGPSLGIKNLTAADAGTYVATIINANSIVKTAPVTLTLAVPIPPTIARQPSLQNINTGNTVVFSVAASGVPAPTYQWRRDGTNIQGANSPTLVLSGTTGNTAAIAGSYSVVVTNGVGTPAISNAATLTVGNTVDLGRLINLSILTPLASGETMTMGTVLGGGGTSGTKSLLARAAGPALSQLGVTTFLPDPKMTLNYTTPTPSVVVATNDDWNGTAALSNAFVSVGAFAYAATNSKDAAIFQAGATALQPGKYTVEVSDTGSGSGTVIAELYDATPSSSFNASVPRLVNVSVLKNIAATDTLTVGFYVGGSTSRTVLIRLIGPGLSAVGLSSGTMPDPQLTLFNSSQATIAANNDWGGDQQITNTGGRVGAFAVGNPLSKDAMLLVTLAPGLYTAQANPVSGTPGGTAIVEVYEVP